jgi:hypothetical protein
MSDKQREALELRAIVVSTRAALLKGGDPATVRKRSDQLMADLESKVIRDGADAQILATIEATRRELWEIEPGQQPKEKE